MHYATLPLSKSPAFYIYAENCVYSLYPFVGTQQAFLVAKHNWFYMLTNIVNDAHNRLRRYVDGIDRAKYNLQSSISQEHFSALHDESMHWKQNQISPTVKEKPPRVVNLSIRQLSPTETSILLCGLKFNSADANYIDFLGNMESILQPVLT